MNQQTHSDGSKGFFGVRALFFALAGALFGALCAADSNVTMTLIADSLANDKMHVIVSEFVRDGGGLRGSVGAVFGLCAGLVLFALMRSPAPAPAQNRGHEFL